MKQALLSASLILCGMMTSASAETLDPHAVRSLFPGRYLVKVMGSIDLKVNMQANGTVTGLSQGQRDTGTWSVEKGKLCITWKNWNSGRKDCSALSRDGNLVKGRGFWFRAA